LPQDARQGKPPQPPPARRPGGLVRPAIRAYLGGMTRLFDMDDHARLPWRFYGHGLRLAAGA
jgi:hypothetical protein